MPGSSNRVRITHIPRTKSFHFRYQTVLPNAAWERRTFTWFSQFSSTADRTTWICWRANEKEENIRNLKWNLKMFDANLQKIYTSVVYYDQCDQIICAVFGNLQQSNFAQ